MSRGPRARSGPCPCPEPAPRLVTAGELLPGDLLALSARDVVAGRWCVVMRTVPEGAELVRLAVRPPLGAAVLEEVFDREWSVIVGGGPRMDDASVPLARTGSSGPLSE